MCGDHTDPLRQRPFPDRADAVPPSDIAIRNLTQRLAFLSEKFKDAEVVRTQACFRPESKRNRPLIGKLGEGLWIASGHSVWGICNGPGTGKVMVSSHPLLCRFIALTLARQSSSLMEKRPLRIFVVYGHEIGKKYIVATRNKYASNRSASGDVIAQIRAHS